MRDLDLEKIKKLLEETSKEALKEKPKKINSVHRFIEDCGIRAGEIRIPNYRIYYEYSKKWRPGTIKANKIVFFREFSEQFPQARTAKNRGFLLNHCMDLDDDTMFKAKIFDLKYEREKKKK